MPWSPRSRRLLGPDGVLIGMAPSCWSPLLAHCNSRSPKTSLLSCGIVFEGRNELGELFVGDAARFADLDAAELAGPEQVVDLVAPDVQHLGYLLDGVCLHGRSPPPVAGCFWAAPLVLVTVSSCLCLCLRTHSSVTTCRRA